MTDTSQPPLRIATRASRLALWQANHVAELLRAAAPDRLVELVEVSTAGDRDAIGSLSQIGGVGVFTREVQAAVLDGRADVAVHSLKDLPTEAVEGLTLAGVPQRGPRFDVLVLPRSRKGVVNSLDVLPAETRVGTGSLRRQAQLLHRRSDLVMSEIRGNVETRLRKLDAGEFDAIVLAQAGLERLGLSDRINLILEPPLMYPAVGQAALGLECRADDLESIELLQRLTDASTLAQVVAERACLHQLRAGCHAPVGVMTESLSDGRLRLEAVVLSPSGSQKLSAVRTGSASEAAELGYDVGRELEQLGVERLLLNKE